MSTSDHLSLSSYTVICLWDQYHADVSTVEPRSLVSVVTNNGIDHMCSSIFNPNFLLQKPFADGTESCIKISAFRCVYFSVTEKWTV